MKKVIKLFLIIFIILSCDSEIEHENSKIDALPIENLNAFIESTQEVKKMFNESLIIDEFMDSVFLSSSAREFFRLSSPQLFSMFMFSVASFTFLTKKAISSPSIFNARATGFVLAVIFLNLSNSSINCLLFLHANPIPALFLLFPLQ